MAQKTGGEIAVAGTEFDDRQRRPRFGCHGRGFFTRRDFLKIIRGQGMGEPIVGGRERLVEIANLIAAEAVEELINVCLPLIDGFIVTDQLG